MLEKRVLNHAVSAMLAFGALIAPSVGQAAEEANVRTVNGRTLTPAMKRQLASLGASSQQTASTQVRQSQGAPDPSSAKGRVQQRLQNARQSAINAARYGSIEHCF